MELFQEFFRFISPQVLVGAGYFVMAVVIFSETGILAGFFLPGDSLLITAGLFAARGDLNIIYINLLLSVCAIAGDATGYMIGSKMGKRLFQKKDTRFFKRKYLEETKFFYEKHGGKTIVLSRFVPIIRTFAPTLAGAVKMPYIKFATFNVFGGLLWVLSMSFTGYFLGYIFPEVIENLELLIVAIIILSFLPILWKYLKNRLDKKRELKE